MFPCAYLRVFQPLEAFPAEDAVHAGYDRQAAWEEGWGNWRRTEVPGAPPKGVWEQ